MRTIVNRESTVGNLQSPGLDSDQAIVDEAIRYIRSDHPDFAFVYLGTLDVAGHAHGWMSPTYMQQLTRVDEIFKP